MSETQSVCKHCGVKIYQAINKLWLTPFTQFRHCVGRPVNRLHEPVSEPASTGEPPDKSDEAFWKYLDENREIVIRWPGWMRGESILEAARPSEPSAPTTPKDRDRDDSPRLIECPTCHKPYMHIAGIFRPVRTCKCGPSAPQTSAEHLKKCVKEGPDCDCVTVCKFDAAPQPVSGDAPKVEEATLPTAEELARKAFIMHFGRDGFANVEVKEKDFILQWLDWGLEALRPSFPPASQTPTISDRPAIEAAVRFIEKEVKPRRCDNDGLASCIRCNSVFLAAKMRELLATPASTARTDGETK